MKMKQAHYEKIRTAIISLTKETPIKEYRQRIIEDSRVKDIDVRLRWDYFWAASRGFDKCFISDNLYTYLNDNHIDTALRSIFKELQEKKGQAK